jgi:hypothetical protein
MGTLALVLLVALAVAAQDARKVVFVPAKQIEAEAFRHEPDVASGSSLLAKQNPANK